MVDSLEIAKKWLTTADTTLYTAVGERVWLQALPSDFDSSSGDVLVIELTDERSEPNGAAHYAILIVRCYAASTKVNSARALFRKVWDRLQMASGTTSAGYLAQASLASALGVVIDSKMGRLTHASRWNFRTEEE